MSSSTLAIMMQRKFEERVSAIRNSKVYQQLLKLVGELAGDYGLPLEEVTRELLVEPIASPASQDTGGNARVTISHRGARRKKPKLEYSSLVPMVVNVIQAWAQAGRKDFRVSDVVEAIAAMGTKKNAYRSSWIGLILHNCVKKGLETKLAPVGNSKRLLNIYQVVGELEIVEPAQKMVNAPIERSKKRTSSGVRGSLSAAIQALLATADKPMAAFEVTAHMRKLGFRRKKLRAVHPVLSSLVKRLLVSRDEDKYVWMTSPSLPSADQPDATRCVAGS